MDNTHVTGFFVLDGLLTREFDATADALWHLILPAITLATIPLAVIVRITRASVLDVLNEDYVRTAEAKGLRHRTIRGRHILRNALLPVVTTIGLQTGALLAGAVLTETGLQLGRPRHADHRLDQRQPGLPGAPGADPAGGAGLRGGQPAGRPLLRASSTRGCVCDE